MRSQWLLGAALMLPLSSLSAQLGQFEPNPNFPNGPTHRLDVSAMLSTATNLTIDACLGVEIDNFGSIWVTSRRSPTTPTTTPHMLYEFKWDSQTMSYKITGYPQPSGTLTSSWGIRDLAYDGKLHLFGGCEFSASGNKIFAFNVITKKWDTNKEITLTSVPSGVATPRAVAFDPTGNSGNGSLWITEWSSAHVEVDLSGTVIRQWPNVQRSCYGAAYDPDRGTIWWYGQAYDLNNSSATTPQAIATEMWTKDGKATGNRVLADRGVAASSATYHAGGIAGGLAFYKDKNGTPLLLMLQQAVSDTVVQVRARFDEGTGSDGVLSMNDHAASNTPLANQTSSPFGLRISGSTATAFVPILGFQSLSIPLVGGGFAPNTMLYTNPVVFGAAVPVQNGTADLPFPIPNDKNLHQAILRFQLVGVHVAQPFALSTTNGGAFALNIL